jgi:hypothetical protein
MDQMHAKYIGILLIGFDREKVPLDVAELWKILPDRLHTWRSVHQGDGGETLPDSYSVRAGKKFRERYWIWYREVV